MAGFVAAGGIAVGAYWLVDTDVQDDLGQRSPEAMSEIPALQLNEPDEKDPTQGTSASGEREDAKLEPDTAAQGNRDTGRRSTSDGTDETPDASTAEAGRVPPVAQPSEAKGGERQATLRSPADETKTENVPRSTQAEPPQNDGADTETATTTSRPVPPKRSSDRPETGLERQAMPDTDGTKDDAGQSEQAPRVEKSASERSRADASGSQPREKPDRAASGAAVSAEAGNTGATPPDAGSDVGSQGAEPSAPSALREAAEALANIETEENTAAEGGAETSQATREAPDSQTSADAGVGRAPTFDVVRVEPGGAAVIAGRAVPNSTVTVFEGDEAIGSADANEAGDFVILPTDRLSSGRSELTLAARTPSGARRESADAVILATPKIGGASGSSDKETETTPPRPLALKVPRKGSAGAEVLQAPAGASGSDKKMSRPALAIRVVQYTARGGLVVSGAATPDRRVVAKLDDKVIGRAKAEEGTGHWSIVHKSRVPPGLYTLSVHSQSDVGKVLDRVETPFASQPRVSGLDDSRVVVVQPGSNLWTIARRTYGEGVQYTTIYRANDDQIADPDLIYPGQVFVLPEENQPGDAATR